MHSYSIELGGRTLTMEIGKIAKQANGAVLVLLPVPKHRVKV